MPQNHAHSPASGGNRLEKLRQLFPACFVEGENGLTVDFDQLRTLIQDEIAGDGQSCAVLQEANQEPPQPATPPRRRLPNFLHQLVLYNETHDIAFDCSLIDVLLDTFEQVAPTLNALAGGSEYRECLESAIRDYCALEHEKVRILDVYDNTKNYAAIVAQV